MENHPNSSNKTCYKFEISLKEPLERNKLRANIFLIFANQDIQDEDVTSIGYVKNETDEKMCDSIVIWIATKIAADKMSQCLDDKERLNEVGFSGYNILEEENFEVVPGYNSRHRSLSTSSSIMTDGIFVVPESESNLSMYFKNETSFYLPKPKATSSVKSLSPTNSMLQLNGDVGGGKEMDENNNNMTISSMIESVEIRGDDENEDKRVEFYSNKPILDKDLSNVILFVENRKASGGGDSISHSLDESRRFLTVQYENLNSKKRVLEKKVHQFEKFKFNANLPFDWKKFEVNPAVIILRGVTTDTTENILQLYTENLVVNDDDSNDVVQIERSKLLQGVVYVTFKKPVDEERIKFRIGKKPKLNDSPISYMKAYTTNISVVRAPQTNDEGRVLVESYFSDENRCGVPPFASSQFPKPFVLLVYNNDKDCLTVLTKDHSIDGKQLKVEYLYNVELFNSGQDNILEVTDDEEEEEEEEKQEDRANNTVTTETTVHSEHDQTMKEDELTADEVEVEPPKNLINEDTESASKEQQQRQNQTPPILTLSIAQEPKVRLFKELSSVFKQFEDELKEREAICQFMIDDGSIRIVCVRQMSNSQFDELTAQWTKEILRFLKEFFVRFELTSLDLENPEDIFPLPTCIKMDPDRCRTVLRAEPGRMVRLEIIGYKQDVDELKAKIENKLTENELVTEKIADLPLPHARIMIVNKYDAELRNRFESLTCQVNTKDRYIEFAGPKKQVQEAMQFTQSLFDSVVKQTMPVDDLVVQFFVDKEKRVVRWMLQTVKIKCVVEPNPTASMLEIYSTNRDQIDELCKAIKREFEPLTIDQSLIELVNDKAYKKFLSQLDDAEDLVYAISPQGLKLCTFKADSDLIYTKFLEELPRD